MADFPAEFDEIAFVEYHVAAFPEDDNLSEKIDLLRQRVRERYAGQLRVIFALLEEVGSFTQKRLAAERPSLPSRAFEIPTKHLAKNVDPTGGLDLVPEQFLKPKSSILEKMWRKNRHAQPMVKLENLTDEVRDLVRFSVVAPTLLHVTHFVQGLSNWKNVVTDPSLYSALMVSVDPEAKLGSGYFAYHAEIVVDQFPIEVQMYSSLTSAWRDLSHLLYEAARRDKPQSTSPGSWNARLVSLGHLLHLADCEWERLVSELKDPKAIA